MDIRETLAERIYTNKVKSYDTAVTWYQLSHIPKQPYLDVADFILSKETLELLRPLYGVSFNEESDMEYVSDKVHKSYCVSYLKKHMKPYWTHGKYNLLDEETKEIDRCTVRAVVKALSDGDVIGVRKKND